MVLETGMTAFLYLLSALSVCVSLRLLSDRLALLGRICVASSKFDTGCGASANIAGAAAVVVVVAIIASATNLC